MTHPALNPAKSCIDERVAPFAPETKSAALNRPYVVAIAREWLGTPYRHQASAKGQGADCLGLLRGVWREVYGREPETPPPYTPDWNEARTAEEPLLTAARRHLRPVDPIMLQPGQVLIIRVARDGPAKHCGIVSADDRFIHAYAGRAVVESWLNRWWLTRLAGVFDFPGIATGTENSEGSPALWLN